MEYTICMYILQVVPLIKLPGQISQTLTYYASESILPGTLILVGVRNTDITAIVYFCQELTNAKQDLKKFANFSPKPIHKRFSENSLLTSQQLELAQWMSNYYAHALGNIIKLFIPKLSNKIKRYPNILNVISPQVELGPDYIPKVFLGTLSKRLKHYHTILKSNIGQILILVPDTISLERLSREFADYNPLLISSQLGITAQRAAWSQVKLGEAKIIIGTRSNIFLPFQHLTHIIIEDESSESYYSFDTKPHYHTTSIAIEVAKLYQANITLASTIPSISTLALLESHNLSLPTEVYPHIPKSKINLIEMQTEFYKGNRDLLSIPAQKAIQKSLQNNQSAIIYVNRRGESLYVSCRDCGYHLRDPKTGTLLTVHRVDTLPKAIPNYTENQVLLSHSSHKWFKMIHICPQCKSLNLHQGGIGIEKIEDFSKSLFPNTPHFVLSSDTASNLEHQQSIVDNFNQTKPAILLTTRMIHKFLDTIPKTLTIIPSAESLVNFPDYTIREKSIQVLSELIMHSDKTLIQTFTAWNRDEESPSHIHTILNHPIAELWEQEYENRNLYHYPPQYEIIAIHSQHHIRSKSLAQALRIKEALSSIHIRALGPLEKYIARGKGLYRFTLTIQTTPKQATSIKRKLVPILEYGQEIEINPPNLV